MNSLSDKAEQAKGMYYGVISSPVGHFVLGMFEQITSDEAQNPDSLPDPVSDAWDMGRKAGEFLGTIKGLIPF